MKHYSERGAQYFK